MLTDAELSAARRTTINAHYTDPAYVAAMWAAMQRLGFEGGRVLEPGSGAGTFMGLAPTGKSIAYDEIFIFRFADGRVVETWGVVDVLSQLRQLGVAPL